MKQRLTVEDYEAASVCDQNKMYRLVTELATKYKMGKERESISIELLDECGYIVNRSCIDRQPLTVHFGKLDNDDILFTECNNSGMECIVTKRYDNVTCKQCLR